MNRTRVSLPQREALLNFMICHPDFARGRIIGPDAARTKTALLQELAAVLNAFESGATKTPEKWWKCWQDWRCDTKAKALKMKKYTNATGGGPGPAPLSSLEQTLLQFCGNEMVHGIVNIPDAMELAESLVPVSHTLDSPPCPAHSPDYKPDHSPDYNLDQSTPPNETLTKGKPKKDDPMLACLAKQAAAMEDMAAAIREVGSELAAAIRDLAVAMQQQQKIIFNSD